MSAIRSRRDCGQYREMINMFVDTELEQDSQHQLFKHLSACNECQNFLEVLMKFKVVRQHDTVEYPAELDSMIFEELKVRKNVYTIGKVDPRIPFWKRRFALSFPMAAVFVLAFALSVGSILYTIGGKVLPIRESLAAMIQQGRQYEKVFVIQEAYVYPQPVFDVIAAKHETKEQHPQL